MSQSLPENSRPPQADKVERTLFNSAEDLALHIWLVFLIQISKVFVCEDKTYFLVKECILSTEKMYWWKCEWKGCDEVENNESWGGFNHRRPHHHHHLIIIITCSWELCNHQACSNLSQSWKDFLLAKNRFAELNFSIFLFHTLVFAACSFKNRPDPTGFVSLLCVQGSNKYVRN